MDEDALYPRTGVTRASLHVPDHVEGPEMPHRLFIIPSLPQPNHLSPIMHVWNRQEIG